MKARNVFVLKKYFFLTLSLNKIERMTKSIPRKFANNNFSKWLVLCFTVFSVLDCFFRGKIGTRQIAINFGLGRSLRYLWLALKSFVQDEAVKDKFLVRCRFEGVGRYKMIDLSWVINWQVLQMGNYVSRNIFSALN